MPRTIMYEWQSNITGMSISALMELVCTKAAAYHVKWKPLNSMDCAICFYCDNEFALNEFKEWLTQEVNDDD